MEPIVFKLSESIQINGETVTEISIVPPRAKHMRKMKLGNMDIDVILSVLSEASAIPSSSIDQMNAADTLRIVEEMDRFFAVGPGVNRSP